MLLAFYNITFISILFLGNIVLLAIYQLSVIHNMKIIIV